MTSTANPTPLLDGPRRSIFLAIVMLVLSLITVDGLLTWLEADDARDVIDAIVDGNPERYPGGIDDRGALLDTADRAAIADGTDGDRLDRDFITTKTWLAVIGLIAAVALTVAAGPGSSRTLLALMIIIAGASFFVPLSFFGDVVDTVTTAHGG